MDVRFSYSCSVCCFFFFKQKTAYEMRISDWSSDVCSSDLRLLTPLYAAPEQILGHPATTAVDIYALGVLLHELLTGARPFATAASTRQEMERAILEADPPAPGEVARQIDADTAARRRSTPRQLARRPHGDLDSIVLKTLRKQPERRYASAAQLSDEHDRASCRGRGCES